MATSEKTCREDENTWKRRYLAPDVSETDVSDTDISGTQISGVDIRLNNRRDE